MADLDPQELARVSHLFEALDNQGRMALLSSATRRRHAPGEVICREGEKGEEFFVITKGEVRVSADDFGTEKELAVLPKSSFFGEMAVLGGHVRNATVTAVGEVELVVFPFEAVLAVLRDRPAAREVLARVGLLRSELTMQRMMES